MRLHTRLSLLLTALAASLLLVLAGFWLYSTRTAIHEEVEAANRVAAQWLHGLVQPAATRAPVAGASLLEQLTAMGRVRANEIEVRDANGALRYRSPPSIYKAGRAAPAWFAALVEPALPAQQLAAGPWQLWLRPDASRAVLDAWEQLLLLAGWGLALLLLLFAATRQALDRSLRPLNEIMAALDHTGPSRLDIRLPVYNDPELGRLSRAFNGMAARLTAAVDHNLRLEDDRERSQENARQWQQRLDAERQAIARELHDELGQGITAVRALAGAIAQRSEDNEPVQQQAQGIVAVTGQMQDGIRTILRRLRPDTAPALMAVSDSHALNALIAAQAARWQQQQPGLQLDCQLHLSRQPCRPVPPAHVLAVLRGVQEGLTNVVRHASARQVRLQLDSTEAQPGRPAGLSLTLDDDGRGPAAGNVSDGCGLGLLGMRERALLCGGEVTLTAGPLGGARLTLTLPWQAEEVHP